MRAVLVVALSSLAVPALADCPGTADALAAAWAARETVPAPEIGGDNDARCIQNAYVNALGGMRIGWKVGLTSAAAQQQFGIDHPVAGRLLGGMILRDGARVERSFGGRPVVEADLLVTVRDGAIMEATTPLEALAHLESLAPFIELADLMVEPGEPLTADIITAINVGARAGVAGTPVPLAPTEEWVAALGAMTVRVEDAGGNKLGDYPGAAILGNPLNALLWLIARLDAVGTELREGDVVSLGSFGPPLAPDDLDGLVVTYIGLPGGIEPTVSVTFE